MRRSKINLEKIKASLAITCPHCRSELSPADWQRVDGERVKCAKCDGLFVPALERERNLMDDLNRQIIDEIYIALQGLKAPPLLLGIVGSWKDTLTEEEVLAALKSWNAGVRQLA